MKKKEQTKIVNL